MFVFYRRFRFKSFISRVRGSTILAAVSRTAALIANLIIDPPRDYR